MSDVLPQQALPPAILFAERTPPKEKAIDRVLVDLQARLLTPFARLRARRLGRIVATTDNDNHASIGVMRRLGMRIEANPFPEPFYFQTIGILDAEARR